MSKATINSTTLIFIVLGTTILFPLVLATISDNNSTFPNVSNTTSIIDVLDVFSAQNVTKANSTLATTNLTGEYLSTLERVFTHDNNTLILGNSNTTNSTSTTTNTTNTYSSSTSTTNTTVSVPSVILNNTISDNNSTFPNVNNTTSIIGGSPPTVISTSPNTLFGSFSSFLDSVFDFLSQMHLTTSSVYNETLRNESLQLAGVKLSNTSISNSNSSSNNSSSDFIIISSLRNGSNSSTMPTASYNETESWVGSWSIETLFKDVLEVFSAQNVTKANSTLATTNLTGEYLSTLERVFTHDNNTLIFGNSTNTSNETIPITDQPLLINVILNSSSTLTSSPSPVNATAGAGIFEPIVDFFQDVLNIF